MTTLFRILLVATGSWILIPGCTQTGASDAGTDPGTQLDAGGDPGAHEDADPGPVADQAGDPAPGDDHMHADEIDAGSDSVHEIDDAEIVSYDLPASLACGETYPA